MKTITVEYFGEREAAPLCTVKERREITKVTGHQKLLAPSAVITLPSCHPVLSCLQPFPQLMPMSGQHGCKSSKGCNTFYLAFSRAGAETKISLHILVPYPPARRVPCVCPSPAFSSFHLLFKEIESNGFTLSQALNEFLISH